MLFEVRTILVYLYSLGLRVLTGCKFCLIFCVIHTKELGLVLFEDTALRLCLVLLTIESCVVLFEGFTICVYLYVDLNIHERLSQGLRSRDHLWLASIKELSYIAVPL